MTQPAASPTPPVSPGPITQENLLWAALLWTAIERLLISTPYPLPDTGAGPKMLLILAKVGLVTISANGKASLTAKGTKLLIDSAA